MILLYGYIHSLNFEAINQEIVKEKEEFTKYDGKKATIMKIKVPTKIVEMPPSHFGISPIAKRDPDKISLKNFQQKLQDSLEGKNEFDVDLMYLIARNNLIKEAQQIIDKLTPEELVKVVTSTSRKFGFSSDLNIPICVAIEEGHLDFIRRILDKVSSQPQLMEKIADIVTKPLGYREDNILSKIGKKGHKKTLKRRTEILKYVATSFSGSPKVIEASIWALLEMKQVDEEFFLSLLLSVSNSIFEKSEKGNTLALKAAEQGHYHLLKIIAEKAPHTLSQKDESGSFPLLYAATTDFTTFTSVWQASPNMLIEKNFRGHTVAHRAAGSNSLQVIQLIAKENPELLNSQDEDKSTPADEAAHNKSLDVLKFLTDNYPETLTKRNRHDWSPAATAANSNGFEWIEYLIEKKPDLILSDFSNIFERAKYWSPKTVELLEKNFPEKVKDWKKYH